MEQRHAYVTRLRAPRQATVWLVTEWPVYSRAPLHESRLQWQGPYRTQAEAEAARDEIEADLERFPGQ